MSNYAYGTYPEKEPPVDPNQKVILVDGFHYTEDAVRKMVQIIKNLSSSGIVWNAWNFQTIKTIPVTGEHVFTSNYKSIIADGAEIYAFPSSSGQEPDWRKIKATVKVCIEINGKLEPIKNYNTTLTLEDAQKEWKQIDHNRWNGPDESQCCF